MKSESNKEAVDKKCCSASKTHTALCYEVNSTKTPQPKKMSVPQTVVSQFWNGHLALLRETPPIPAQPLRSHSGHAYTNIYTHKQACKKIRKRQGSKVTRKTLGWKKAFFTCCYFQSSIIASLFGFSWSRSSLQEASLMRTYLSWP